MPVMSSVVVKWTAYRVICRKPVLFSWVLKLRSNFSLLESFAFLISPNWRPKLPVKERKGFFFFYSLKCTCARGGSGSLIFTWQKQRFQKVTPFLTPHISALREREDIISAANNKWKSEEDKSSRVQNTRVWQIKKKNTHGGTSGTHTAFTRGLVWCTHTHTVESFIQDTRCAQEDDIKWL